MTDNSGSKENLLLLPRGSAVLSPAYADTTNDRFDRQSALKGLLRHVVCKRAELGAKRCTTDLDQYGTVVWPKVHDREMLIDLRRQNLRIGLSMRDG
jgi:hypothetical protein